MSGKALLPGAALLELASAAGLLSLSPSQPTAAKQSTAHTKAHSPSHLALRNVTLNAPLTIPDPATARTSRPALIMINPAAGRFEIVSPPQSAKAAAVQHVQGEVARVQGTAAAALMGAEQLRASVSAKEGVARPRAVSAVDAARAQCVDPRDAAHLYSALRGVGLDYGPAFRLLDSIHSSAPDQTAGTGASSATASITHKHTGKWGSSNFVCHPAALDCAFQLGAAVPSKSGGSQQAPDRSQVYVPASVELFLLDCGHMGNMGHGQVGMSGSDLFFSCCEFSPSWLKMQCLMVKRYTSCPHPHTGTPCRRSLPRTCL